MSIKNKGELQPIILLGAGRSGTKFLRSVLASSKDIVAVPYDVGYVWRYGNERVEHDELTLAMLNEPIKQYVRKTLPKLIDRSDHCDPYFFVEKSVPNTLRPCFVYNIYPDAKFIHLVRDGRSVTESAMRMWQKPPDRSYLLKKLLYFPWSNYKYGLWYMKNLIVGKFSGDRRQNIWGPRYNGISQDIVADPLSIVCAKQWKHCVNVCHEQIRNIPKNNIIEIRYEDLVGDSNSLEKICNFLNIGDIDTVVDFFNKNVVRENIDIWKTRFSPPILEAVVGEISDELRRYGYIEKP